MVKSKQCQEIPKALGDCSEDKGVGGAVLTGLNALQLQQKLSQIVPRHFQILIGSADGASRHQHVHPQSLRQRVHEKFSSVACIGGFKT